MGYDEAVQVVAEVIPVGNNDTSGFSNLLSSKTKNIFLIIGIVVGAAILATIVIIIICLLCNYCPKRAVVTLLTHFSIFQRNLRKRNLDGKERMKCMD
jgi:hypothetical protein